MRVDLDGFVDVDEAREAAMLFLRETKNPKARGPLGTYGDSYSATSGASRSGQGHSRESSSPFAALLRRISGGALA